MDIVAALVVASIAVFSSHYHKSKQVVEEPVIILQIEHRNCEFDEKEVRFSNLTKRDQERVYLRNDLPCVDRKNTGINYEKVVIKRSP